MENRANVAVALVTVKQRGPAHRPRTARLIKEFGKVVIDQVTIDQCVGGARDIRCLVTDISYLDPQEGIRFRGKTIPETFEALPKAAGSDYPTVEAFWYFLLTGDIPTQAQVDDVVSEWKVRQVVPPYVFDTLRALPRDIHPMTMLSIGILSMQKDSKFAAAYHVPGKYNKTNAWEFLYEDASDLVARIPIENDCPLLVDVHSLWNVARLPSDRAHAAGGNRRARDSDQIL